MFTVRIQKYISKLLTSFTGWCDQICSMNRNKKSPFHHLKNGGQKNDVDYEIDT